LDEIWNKMVDLLVRYRDDNNGDCNVPYGLVTKELPTDQVNYHIIVDRSWMRWWMLVVCG
jgi:hypothetical protein